MKKKKILGLVTLATVAALALTACGGGGNSKGDDKDKSKGKGDVATEDISKLAIKTSNKDKAIKDGQLDVAVATDTQFAGLFLWELYENAYDETFMRPSHGSGEVFSTDEDFRITNDGAVKLDLDQEKNMATLTLQKDLMWSDGEKVKVEDFIYSYEIMGHKDYTGIRYDDKLTNIVGMEEYHDGTADTISGITAVDDKTFTIQYKNVHPGMMQAGGGIWAYAAPKHVLKDIPVGELESSDAVRKNPVTYGPYYMSKIVPGESVEYSPNKYYHLGKPKLKKIVFKSVSTSSVVESLKSQQYDMVFSMPTDTYSTYKDVEGYEMLARKEQAYTYIGFKMGKLDKEANTVIYNPESKMANKSLRQAMGYAVDNDAVGQKFYNGLRSGATTLIPPIFETLHDDKTKGYNYDLAKAKKLLDEAGYKDKDDDGFREDPKGEKLVIKFASMAGGETAQPLADYYIQQWKKIGLKVEYTTGRLIDFQAFYDKLKQDDPEIDVFQAAWGTGTDPSPTGLYGRNSAFNYTRFADEKNDELLKAIDSKDSFDTDKRKKAFDEWQAYAAEEAFVIPTLYRNEILPIHNRVKDFDWTANTDSLSWSKVSVTEKTRK